jgi:LmbE family N-acetylglucosaminyl deacetylase
MDRRTFLNNSIGFTVIPSAFRPGEQQDDLLDDVFVERAQSGQPHKGKVLAAIQPHCDDIPIFAAGTVAKLIREGYTGYLIRTTNDDHAGRGETLGDVIKNNSMDNDAVAKALGLKKVFNLNYRNHRMDEVSIQEIKSRLIFLFRLLKVDTIVSYDPWGHYEENPDHYVTARAVEAARWMAGGGRDYPEHLEAGLQPHAVQERYYFARGPQLVNRVVDISDTLEDKINANLVNVTQGPAGDRGSALRKRLAEQGKYLPILGDDDDTANRAYIQHFVLDIDSQRLRGVPSDREVGKVFGLEWAERFHYIGPEPSQLDKYMKENLRDR